MFIWLNSQFTHFGIRKKCCFRERCDEFVEEASVWSVDCVEEKMKRCSLRLREWSAFDEFGDENSVLECVETRSDYDGLNFVPLFQVLVVL